MFPTGSPVNVSFNDRFIEIYRGIRNPAIDYMMGGVAIGDPSSGLQFQKWRARIEGNHVLLGSEKTGPLYRDEYSVLEMRAINEVTLAFDNNMNPAICVKKIDEPVIFLQYYDTLTNQYQIMQINEVIEPFLRLDDNRAGAYGRNDIILMYNRNNYIMYRLQRDRYTIEYPFFELHPWQKIYQAGMTVKLRFQFETVWDPDKMRDCY
jgi:hypothetical protein